MLEVKRPAPPKRKINTRDDFELCLLRHQYFRRAKYNPTEEEMKPYMYIVENLSKNTFFTYFNLFKSVGMYQDDVLNIGRVHLVSFLGLYSLEKMESKKKSSQITLYDISIGKLLKQILIKKTELILHYFSNKEWKT